METENIDVFDFRLEEAEMEELSARNEHYASLSSLPYD